MKGEATLTYKYIQIFAVVSIYWAVSILTVFINKTILSGASVGLNAPLFITWFQCLVSFLICFTMSRTKGIPGIFNFPDGTPWNLDTLKKVLPLSVVFTAMIASSNICLQYVGVAFYTVSRSLTTVFNVIFCYTLLGQKTSTQCIMCCALIVGGFWLGIDQENLIGTLSWYGTMFGVIGSITLSLYSIYTKRILPLVNQEIWLLSYYNNAYSLFLFLPFIAFSGEITEVLHFRHLYSIIFWMQMVGSGICGFAIGYVTSLQIKVTSPLTHNISGTAKAVSQTVIATYWYDELKPVLWWTSNIMVLFGSALYARFKQLEMEKAATVKADEGSKEEKQVLV